MTPLNWFGVIVETVLLHTAANQHSNWIGIAYFSFAVFLALAYLGVYIYNLLKRPSSLQSEEYNLYQQEMLIGNGKFSLSDEHRTIDAQSNQFFDTKDGDAPQ